MASASVFTNRLSTLSESLKQTQTLISRLSKLQIQPGTVTGTSDAPGELAAEIHGRLREITEALEVLREDVDTFSAGSSGRAKEGDATRLEAGTARLEEDIRLARGQFRKAQLQAKQAAETARRKERELLFSSTTEESVARRKREKREKLTQDDLVTSASEDVTAALRRTHALMTTELTRSRFAQETLEDSSKALESLGESYLSLDDILKNSKALVSSLLSSQKSDTWYLETTVYILLSTVIWLIFRRFFYGPLWWFVWLPLKGLYWVLGTIIGSSISLGRSESAGSNTVSQASLSASSWVSGNAPSAATQVSSGTAPTASSGDSNSGSGDHMEEVQRVVDEANNQAGDGSSGQTQEQQQQQQQQAEDGQEQEQAQRNPKKRMWEEPVEEQKHAAEQERDKEL